MPAEIATFHSGSGTHLACVVVAGSVVAVICAAGWRTTRGGVFDRALAAVLLLVWLVCQGQDLMPGNVRWDRSLPLHICDLVGLFAPLAVLSRHRLPRALTYFWGLGLSTQAFVTPVLFRGPAWVDFWTFWACHTAIVVAAAYDLIVRGYRPVWADWRNVCLAGVAYAALVIPIDLRLGVNYGYLGPSDFGQTTLMHLLGPWPRRLPQLYLLVWCGTAAMTWPWTGPVRKSIFSGSTPIQLPRPQPVPVRRAA